MTKSAVNVLVDDLQVAEEGNRKVSDWCTGKSQHCRVDGSAQPWYVYPKIGLLCIFFIWYFVSLHFCVALLLSTHVCCVFNKIIVIVIVRSMTTFQGRGGTIALHCLFPLAPKIRVTPLERGAGRGAVCGRAAGSTVGGPCAAAAAECLQSSSWDDRASPATARSPRPSSPSSPPARHRTCLQPPVAPHHNSRSNISAAEAYNYRPRCRPCNAAYEGGPECEGGK